MLNNFILSKIKSIIQIMQTNDNNYSKQNHKLLQYINPLINKTKQNII